jgi:prevent-host-death family protein
MKQTPLVIPATKARQQFFRLLKQAEKGKKVIITYKKSKERFVLEAHII